MSAPGADGGCESVGGGGPTAAGHVGLDLRDREGAVVEPEIVDQAAEELVPDRVAADPEGAGRGRHRAGRRRRARERAVDIEAHDAAVVGGGEVRPGIRRQRGRTSCLDLARAEPEIRARALAAVVRVERVDERAGLLLERDRPPAVGRARTHPGLERHRVRQVERGRVGHGDHVVDTVERERAAVPAGCGPDRARDRAGMAAAGYVGERRAAAGVERVRRDERGRAGPAVKVAV